MSDIFLPYQQRWLADESDVKIWEKSRRIGATWAEAADHVLRGAKKQGTDTFYIGYNQEIAREFIGDVSMWARTFNEATSDIADFVFEDEGKAIKAFRIEYASGFSTVALSSRPTNLRGRQGIILIDEAAFHDDLPGLLKAAMAHKMWGGKVRIISSHFGEDNDFNDLIKSVRAGRKNFSIHRTDLDDALSEGLYRRICQKLGTKFFKLGQEKWREELIKEYGDFADEELFCIPSQGGGAYFTRVMVEQNMDKALSVTSYQMSADLSIASECDRRGVVADWLEDVIAPLCQNLHPTYKTSYGMDFARSGDLSYFVALQEQPNLIRKAVICLELKNIPFSQQEQILFFIGDRLPRFVAGAHDARGNGQSLAEKAADRWGRNRIHQVMLSNPWYLENFPKYKAAHEDRTVVLPANSDLLEDHRMIILDRGIPKPSEKRSKGTKGEQRHGDGAVAACLAWFASSQISIGFPSLGSAEFDGW